MKYLLLQHWNGPLGELEEYSVLNMQRYAADCGADYELMRGAPFDPKLSAQSQKMAAFDKKYDDYDVVVMLDTDMFTRRGMDKNIFTDETGIGRHYGIQTHLRKKLFYEFPLLCDLNYPYFGGSCYRLTREIRQRFRKHFYLSEMTQFSGNYNDEGIMHRCAVLSGLKEYPGIYFDRQQWNFSSFDEGVEDAYIIHIRPKVTPTGPKRAKIENYRALVKKGII